MTTVWITGARGFIGRHLARRLASDEVVVAGVGHGMWLPREAAGWGVTTWVNGGVAPSNLDRLVDEHGLPSAVYHLAGGSAVGPSMSQPEEDFRRTVVSTSTVLEWLRRRAGDARFVLASSAAVYGGGHTGAIPESANLAPTSPYGNHKRMAEQLVESYMQSFGLSAGIVRLFSVYGAELRKQLLWDICTRLSADPAVLSLGGTGLELRDWLHVEDAVELLTLAGSPVAPTVLNGGTGTATEVAAIASQVRDAWGSAAAVEFTGVRRPGDPASLVADVTRARSLGFAPRRAWRDGLDEYVRWWKASGEPVAAGR